MAGQRHHLRSSLTLLQQRQGGLHQVQEGQHIRIEGRVKVAGRGAQQRSETSGGRIAD